MLKRLGVPTSHVFIFVANEAEGQKYKTRLGAEWPNIIVGVPSLFQQRNFINGYFDEGTHLLCLDDDVEEF